MIERGPRIDTNGSVTEKQLRRQQYMERINAIHDTSGLTLREVARECDVDHSYVHYILNGERRPKRDVLIALGFAYRLDRLEVDELLLLADLPPLGRSARQELGFDTPYNGTAVEPGA